MRQVKRVPNPDVNSIDTTDDLGTNEENRSPSDRDTSNPGQAGNDGIVPTPPDRQPVTPIEDPPAGRDAPLGDVDDSPKRIAGKD